MFLSPKGVLKYIGEDNLKYYERSKDIFFRNLNEYLAFLSSGCRFRILRKSKFKIYKNILNILR